MGEGHSANTNALGVLSVYGCGTHFYGSARRDDLPIDLAAVAEQQGYDPYTYQAIKWVTALHVPLVPLGAYRLQRKKQPFWTLRRPRFQIERVEWDWGQVVRHYATTACVGLAALALIDALQRLAAAGY